MNLCERRAKEYRFSASSFRLRSPSVSRRMAAELRRLVIERTREFEALAAGSDAVLSAIHLATCVAPLRRLYSYAVPSDDALDVLTQYGQPHGVLELGAGTGLWASELRHRGCRVAAFDIAPVDADSRHNGYHHASDGARVPAFTRVLPVGDNTVSELARCQALLFLCWPPAEEAEAHTTPAEVRYLARDALAAFTGDTVAYIGELPSDAPLSTAGPLFHGALHRDWTLLHQMPMQLRFPGCVDSLSIWRRVHPQPMPLPVDPSAQSQLTTDHGPSDRAVASARRAQRVASMAGVWHTTAAEHIAMRRLQGGPRARPGPEAEAVRQALSSSGPGARPLLRRLLTRALCTL